jgi:ferrous iron transport protein B
MRLVWYLKEAVPLFVLGTLLLFTADKLNLIIVVENFFRPVVVNFLGLPAEVTKAFILGFLRRDYGAAGLFTLAREGFLSPRQVLTSIVVITLFVPCIAQCFMVVKERGLKIAVMIFLFVSAYAIAYGGLLNFLLKYFGII